MKKIILSVCMSLLLLAGALNAHGASSLVEWNLANQPGNETSVAASFSATNVSGLDLTRGAGLTPNAADNSFSSAGWTQESTDYVQFGLTVAPGYMADISDLYIGTRSSSTGPRYLDLYVSTDGYSTPLTRFDQSPGGNYVNSFVSLSPLNDLAGDVYFRLFQYGTEAANGGTTLSAGTFRVTNYLQDNVNGSLRLTGSVSPVPVPGAVWLLGSGLLGLTGWRRLRKA